MLDELLPDSPHRPRDGPIRFVDDRPGHDKRYALDGGELRRELGWSSKEDFESGLRKTAMWYLDNRDWWQAILAETYRGERLGVGTAVDS